jgi:hypothetical protein
MRHPSVLCKSWVANMWREPSPPRPSARLVAPSLQHISHLSRLGTYSMRSLRGTIPCGVIWTCRHMCLRRWYRCRCTSAQAPRQSWRQLVVQMRHFCAITLCAIAPFAPVSSRWCATLVCRCRSIAKYCNPAEKFQYAFSVCRGQQVLLLVKTSGGHHSTCYNFRRTPQY